MANSFIHYKVTNGVEYASVFTPRRDKGKKVNDPEYLGRVVNKENGIVDEIQRYVVPIRPKRSTPRRASPRKSKFHHNQKANC